MHSKGASGTHDKRRCGARLSGGCERRRARHGGIGGLQEQQHVAWLLSAHLAGPHLSASSRHVRAFFASLTRRAGAQTARLRTRVACGRGAVAALVQGKLPFPLLPPLLARSASPHPSTPAHEQSVLPCGPHRPPTSPLLPRPHRALRWR